MRGAICPLGDLDGNCKVDLVDVQMLVDRWLDPACAAPDCEADLFPGSGVNLLDYVQLAHNNDKTGVHVVISEFMAKNDGSFITYIDEVEMEELDWIELYNPSDTVVDLGGCYLTDRAGNKTKWQFPPGTILRGNSYLVVFASDKTEEENPTNYPFVDDLGYLHTNFKLDKEGDYLALVLSDGSTVECQYPTTWPVPDEYSQQYMNWTYGFSQNLMSEGYFYPATPGKPNNSNPISDPTKNIFISEIMYHPYHVREEILGITPEPLGEEYIEIYNRGIESVDLAGWRLDNGVSFTIPDIPGVVLDPNAYLVIAADVTTFNQTYTVPTGVTVIGGWEGKLSNRGETVELVDENGLRMDRVRYADEGDWAERELGPLDHEHRGWQWKDDHDGDGKSLELINPALSNNYGQNWSASLLTGGTPGAVNSVASANIAPMILEVEHQPIIPKSNEAVRVTARIRDEQTLGHTVKLYYRVDVSDYDEDNPADQDIYPTFNPGSYTEVLMLDDGLGDNGRANDGVFGAEIPAQAAGTIMEFFVEASDGVLSRTWPAPADMDGSPEQVTNCLYQVYTPDGLFDPDEEWVPGARPVFHFVMTNRAKLRLKDIGNDGDAYLDEPRTDAQMNTTFISVDGSGTRVRYNTGVRNRGNISRREPPNNYRLNFRHDESWKGITALNINSKYAFSQVIGSAIWRMAGLPAVEATAVQLRVNSENLALGDSNMYGSYACLEAYDSDWADNHFPHDNAGNVYRCSYHRVGGEGSDRTYADLEHKGISPFRNPDDYRDNYFKQSNGAQDDWEDLFDLIDVLMNSGISDEEFLAQVSQKINLEKWMRYIAVDALSGNLEGGLCYGHGDDYALYRGGIDTRFWLAPHDLDTLLGQGDKTPDYDRDIFVYDGDRVKGLHRLLNHPAIVKLYFSQYMELIDTMFSPGQFDPFMDHALGGIISQSLINQMKQYVVRRINDPSAVLDQIPHEAFSVSSNLPLVSGYYQTTSSTATGSDISGAANSSEVVSVLVNGQVANNWSQKSGTWSLSSGPTINLNPGINRVIVQTFDGLNGTGNERERKYIDIWYDDTTFEPVPNPLTQTNTILDAASGPWYLAGNLTVPSGYTLTIEPGTTVYFNQGVRVTVNGRLAAEGMEYQRIRLTAEPGSVETWGGMHFDGSIEDNRLCYVDMEDSSSASNSIRLDDSKVLLDDVTWTPTHKTILQIEDSSAQVRNCSFPDNLSNQSVSGHRLLTSDPFLIFEGNIFGVHSGTKSDVLDCTTSGSSVVVRLINNVFLGGGDDALDLDGTRSYIDGNVFMNFHRNFSASEGESYAVSSGYDAGHSSRHMIVRNLFIDCDHAALVKDQSWIHVENNTLINCSVGINFDEPAEGGIDPGVGAYLDGNIFWNVGTPLAQYYVDHPTWGTTDITLNRSIIPSLWHSFGEGNIDANPLFEDEQNDDYHLRSMSPALGNGDNGIDMGRYVPEGVSVSVKTNQTDATVRAAGPGITDYQYVINDPNGPWSSERSVDEPIELSGLTDGLTYTVYARGKTYAGVWLTDPNLYGSVSWTVDASEIRLRINEVLAINRVAVKKDGMYPDLIELFNDGPAPVSLDGMSISDDPAFPTKYVFSGGGSLGPNQYLVLAADPNTANPLYVGFALDGGGEGVYLYNGSGELIDSVAFGPQIPDLSIGRYTGGRWQLTVPTFGQANVVTYTGDWQSLKINEWLTSEEVLFEDDFIELYNPELHPVEVSELYLTDNPVSQQGKDKLGPLAFAGAEGHVVYEADDRVAASHVDFQLSAEQELIGLFDDNLSEIDKVYYRPQTTDVSEGRSDDGESSFAFFELPTPGLPNTAAGTQPMTLYLITSSAEVKYFVPLDSTWESTWMQAGFSELGTWTSDTTALGFGEVFGVSGTAWQAFNDCQTDPLGATQSNVTQYTTYDGSIDPTSGPLKNFETGSEQDMPTVTFSMVGSVGSSSSGSSAGAPASGTDAYEVFYDDQDQPIVDFYGNLVNSPDAVGWSHTITFTDLNPNAVYTFVGTAIRANDYPDRHTRVTISGHSGAVNNSSAALGAAPGDDYAVFQPGDNRSTGYVVRWDNINPGPDGSFTITSVDEPSAGGNDKSYPVNGFLLSGSGGGQNDLYQGMVGTNATLWTRIEFNLDADPSELTSLTLKMRYDDAFAAYLNGNEVARSNFTGAPLWNSQADTPRDNSLAADFETFDLSGHINELQQGTNVLAVQVLNESMNDPNLLFLPELTTIRDPNDGFLSYDEAIDLLNGLRITEMMYHPQDEPTSHPDAEFIELQNVGPDDLNLTDVRFTNGIDFTFPAMILPSGDYVVIVKDQTIFQSQYGVIPEVIGEYEGSLSNGGENIVLKLTEPLEAAILRFEYNDTWYPTTDGGGYALVINDPLGPAATWEERDYWSAGSVLGGSPGTADP